MVTATPSVAAEDNSSHEIPPSDVLTPPLFRNSITELRDLSASISGFLQRYDDLHNHLQSIKSAISAKIPPETPVISQPPPPEKEKVIEKSELESLCNTMCSRGLRKYLINHLPNLQMLREEVPKALRQAPNPSKLVWECFGKFFLQGSKAFTRNSNMIPGREASILVLECFLLMTGLDVTSETSNLVLEIEKTVKKETNVSALAWRKRLVAEGGVAKASQIDARGLLLFVACFGIPALFSVLDIRDLVIAGNAKEIVGVLQKSHVLMSKIAEMVEEMMKKKMEVDAVDIVYTFGLEERFNPQKVLVSFLRESNDTLEKTKKGSQGSPDTLHGAKKKQLATLNSISKCLEKHGVDPVKLLPEWQISEKIATLEKEISDFDRISGDKTAQKRTSGETEPSTRPNAQEAKRPRHVGHGPQQQRADHVDRRRNLLESRVPNHVNRIGASAVVYGGPGAQLLPENMIPTGIGVSRHGSHPYAAINERYTGPPPPLGLTAGFLGNTPSSLCPPLPLGLTAGFPGNTPSSVGHGNQGFASDLYQFADSVGTHDLYKFADSVVESEFNPSRSVPRSVAAGPSAGPAHFSSDLYKP